MVQKMIGAAAMAFGTSGAVAQVQDIGFEGSIGIVSDYSASGETQSSRRPALQFTGLAFVPQGFYAGLFLSNVDFTGPYGPYPDPERGELSLFVGWERDFDSGISLDLGYEHFWYDTTGDCCGNFYLGADTFLSDQLEIGGLVTWNPKSENTNIRAMMALYPTDQIGLRAMLGRNQSGLFGTRVTYANLGADYYLTDTVMASLDAHKSNSPVASSDLVFGLSFAF